ncbi:MAG TPA: multidrug ABC transporter substrate-binding protein, partial [Bryobacteraceae bacterium]|nr:multidrug ABC transporter substrate-binding protein [Bryobacteraceae bacterium]
LDAVARDVRFGLRMLRRTPGFTIVTLLTLGIGLGIGLVAAVALSRFMKSLLFGVSEMDPVTYIAVPIVLTTAAVVASYLPARRATQVDPIETLRAE